METLGQRLRRLRTHKGLSLDELAATTGVSKPYLWRLETSSDANPSVEVVQKLADGLGIAISELLSAPEDRKGDVEIPPALRQAQDDFSIPESDLGDLARIRFRGAQPMTAEDWGVLYLQLKRSVPRE